jgi:hypothetical protein
VTAQVVDHTNLVTALSGGLDEAVGGIEASVAG